MPVSLTIILNSEFSRPEENKFSVGIRRNDKSNEAVLVPADYEFPVMNELGFTLVDYQITTPLEKPILTIFRDLQSLFNQKIKIANSSIISVYKYSPIDHFLLKRIIVDYSEYGNKFSFLFHSFFHVLLLKKMMNRAQTIHQPSSLKFYLEKGTFGCILASRVLIDEQSVQKITIPWKRKPLWLLCCH